MTLTVLYADDHLVAVDRPAGLLSVPGLGPDKADCAVARVQALYPDALTVHRLDMSTSGVLVFGRGVTAQRALSMAFEQRQVDKRYEALVWGWPAQAEGEIKLPLIADWPNRPLQKVCLHQGKPSITQWQRLAAVPGGARLALTPLTGRTHQLRVHLQAIGHPILGDALYATAWPGATASRLMLHAAMLELPHPATGDWITLKAPVPF
ncbi:RluA family pseudouridine synthase [Ideonella sp.]|uniref:RluA family pseudouridine synthase n=1 Tax=Ideonella sp. TaxID=1929293 RepID=UPI003BB4F2A4